MPCAGFAITVRVLYMTCVTPSTISGTTPMAAGVACVVLVEVGAAVEVAAVADSSAATPLTLSEFRLLLADGRVVDKICAVTSGASVVVLCEARIGATTM